MAGYQSKSYQMLGGDLGLLYEKTQEARDKVTRALKALLVPCYTAHVWHALIVIALESIHPACFIFLQETNKNHGSFVVP